VIDTDVLVVGAGPVGLATAIEARLAGLSVTIVEPREDVIDKACGEGLMPGALPLLARLGVDPVGMPLRGVSYRTATRHADYLFRSGIGRGVRRTTLHDALSTRAAQLGVERAVGRVDTVEQDAESVTAAGIRASWLLACDGLHSTVRRAAGLEANARGRTRFGIRQHFAVAPWSELIEVHWAKHAEVYVTPVDAGITGIAILGPRGTDFDATVRGIPELADRLGDAERVSARRGAGPFLQRATRPSAGRVLLVGDASGYVDAITGEGLRLGFEQAALAVRSIVEGAPQRYDRRWARATRDFRVLTSGLVSAATGPFRGAIVPLAARLPGVYGAVVERLAR
jgi:flavin-dependent dehydrogenase